MKKPIVLTILGLTLVLSVLLHWKVFTQELAGIHSWRQCQTQWNIINFNRYDSNILNPRVGHFQWGTQSNLYRYEFPVLQWGIASLQHVFGDAIVVTRGSIFVIGLFTLLAFYFLLLALLSDRLVAALGVFVFNFSPVFYYYTMNPLPDSLALCFGMWYLAFFVRAVNSEEKDRKQAIRNHVFAAFCLMGAALVKLPFVLLGGASFAFVLGLLVKNRFANIKQIIIYCSIYLLLIIPAALWYAWVVPTWSNGVLVGIFHEDFDWVQAWDILQFHILVMFPQILFTPFSLGFMLAGAYFMLRLKLYKKAVVLPLFFAYLLVVFYFIMEINMIGKVHDYYMMPFLPFLFILIMYGVKKAWYQNRLTKGLALLGLLTIPILCVMETQDKWLPTSSWYNKDLYEHQAALQAAVPKDEVCLVFARDPSTHVFNYLIDKRAFMVTNSKIGEPLLRKLIKDNDLKYLYSDIRKVDTRDYLLDMVEDTLLEAGSIRVFKLKEL